MPCSSSMKAGHRAEQIADAQGYTGASSGATLGDVMRNKLKGFTQKSDE